MVRAVAGVEISCAAEVDIVILAKDEGTKSYTVSTPPVDGLTVVKDSVEPA